MMTPEQRQSLRTVVENGAYGTPGMSRNLLALMDDFDSLENMFSDLAREAPTLLREKDNAERDAANQRAIAQGAEADYRRVKAERDVAHGVLRRIRALAVGRADVSSRVLRGMIDAIGLR